MILGTGIGIGFAGSGGGGAAYSPLSETDLVAWWTTDANTTTDGAAVDTLIDKSSTGADLTPHASGTEAIYESDRWNGTPSIRFQGDCLSTAAAAVIALGQGTDVEFTMVEVVQPIAIAGVTGYHGVFGNATNSRYIQMRHDSADYKCEFICRSSGGVHAAQEALSYVSPTPQVRVWRRLADQLQVGEDGAEDPPLALDMGSFDGVTHYAIGAIPTTTPVSGNGHFQIKHQFLFSGNKSAAELADLYAWIRANVPGLDWKAGLGATAGHAAGTLVIPILGQSNAAGRAVGSYAHSADRVWALYSDGFRKELNDPVTAAANSVFVVNDSNPGNSLCGRLADALRTLGWQHDILFVNAAEGGTSSATWASGATTNPPSTGSRVGKAKHLISEALKAPGAVLGPVIVYQGETDAVNSTAAEWGGNWDGVLSELKTHFSGEFLDDDAAFVVVKLPAAAPASGGYPDWENVRTAQQTLVDTTRADCLIVQAPAATLDSGLHLDMGSDDTEGLRKLAVDIVAAWHTAVGGPP